MEWVSFDEIKKAVTLRMVIDRYGIRLKQVGPQTLRGRCPLPTHTSEKSRESFTATLDKGQGGAPKAFAEKDEEEKLRAMERENRKLSYIDKNGEIRERIEVREEQAARRKNPPPQPPRLSKIEKVARAKERAARDLEKHPNDPDMRNLIQRQSDDEIMRIMEGSE